MLKITVKEIEKMLTNIWPSLRQIWCFDQEYDFPSLSMVTRFVVEDLSMESIKMVNPDCDDYALQLHAHVKRHENWSFGEVFANKVGGWSKLHNLNICCCREGVVLIEPRKKTIWIADNTNDNILWVRI